MATRKSQKLPPSAELHPLGQISTATHADAVRHAHLRASFMNALLRDPRITELFDTWGKETGLYTVAVAVARAAQDRARAMKVSHWMDPIHIDDDEANLAAPLMETFEAVTERFFLMLQPANRPHCIRGLPRSCATR